MNVQHSLNTIETRHKLKHTKLRENIVTDEVYQSEGGRNPM